ncbi:hypothetical protein, partial [Flavonifractor sp. HCP28S3_F3]|uniref:hypothetical protein n=1 Tax=Flavonifractor sp. HCP28S3_F3 TaxID=3438939 RepID=UPI003F8ADAEF
RRGGEADAPHPPPPPPHPLKTAKEGELRFPHLWKLPLGIGSLQPRGVHPIGGPAGGSSAAKDKHSINMQLCVKEHGEIPVEPEQ